MDVDKYIGGRRVRKTGLSQHEDQEIERKAILSIMSNSETLSSLFDEISMYTPSMVSPTASPIKHYTDSNTTFNYQYTPIRQFMQQPSKKPSQAEKQSINPEIKNLKKKTISSVHFANYMQPIGKVSEKFKGILEKQRKMKETEEQRELYRINHMKNKTKEEYLFVQSKYQGYEKRNSSKEAAVASRLVEKEESQMSGVTFRPTINNNIIVKEPFQARLLQSQKKKQIKSAKIIQQSTKNQTYHPKINQNKESESKIKKIWLKLPHKEKDSVSSVPIHEYSLDDLMSDRPLTNPLKISKLTDLDFMIKH